MCDFFSLISNGKGAIYYFDWNLRQQILKGKLKIGNNKITEADSHSSILEYLQNKRNYIGNDFDRKFNKYEFNPLTKEFTIDRIDVKDDSKIVETKCLKLDFNRIIKPLIVKDIMPPFKDKRKDKISNKDIELLKQWDSVWDSVRDSVWDSVGDSVRDSVRDLVWDSVGDSVGDSVWASVRDSVGDSVWDSVWASVWAYISSFFDLEKWKYIDHKKGVNPYQCMIDLWNKGIVPSYDDKIWRLHGYKGKIIWEDKKNIIK